jgi:hypothetical protein
VGECRCQNCGQHKWGRGAVVEIVDNASGGTGAVVEVVAKGVVVEIVANASARGRCS